MPRLIQTLDIDGPAGLLEALLEEPEHGAPHTAALVCHPHPLGGGTMHNKVVYRMARGLRRAGAAVLRFNFRGVGRSQGQHGNLTGEIEDARAALEWLRGRYPGLPFGLAGFSFGARVITRLGCQTDGTRWLLATGFATVMGTAEYLERCGLPKVFVQSTRDQYGPRPEFEKAYAGWAEPKRLVWIDAEDHFFAGALDRFEEAVFEAGRDLSRLSTSNP
jgi:uncharacterized protein